MGTEFIKEGQRWSYKKGDDKENILISRIDIPNQIVHFAYYLDDEIIYLSHSYKFI